MIEPLRHVRDPLRPRPIDVGFAGDAPLTLQCGDSATKSINMLRVPLLRVPPCCVGPLLAESGRPRSEYDFSAPSLSFSYR